MMPAETTCLVIMPDCSLCRAEEMMLELRDPTHQCDELCEVNGEARRASAEFHSLMHAPIRCDGCGHILDDRLGNDRMVRALCASECCTRWECPDCGEEWASAGPVACPTCGDMTRRERALHWMWTKFVFPVWKLTYGLRGGRRRKRY